MREPKISDFTECDGEIDYDAYNEALGDYEDVSYQEWKDEHFEDKSIQEEEK